MIFRSPFAAAGPVRWLRRSLVTAWLLAPVVGRSADFGKTWRAEGKLVTTGPGDMGYPSTAQRADGKLVTAFYAAQSPLHAGYQIGSIGWNAVEANPR